MLKRLVFVLALLVPLAGPACGGTLYVDTGGATTNGGSSDNNAPDLSGTGDALVTGSVVTLTNGTVLTGVNTSGVNQSAIYLAQATNANQKIFWITAVAGSGGATPQVTVSVAPTGITASNWAIGGRMVYTSANFESTLVAGDTVIINNSPASKTGSAFYTLRASGTSAAGFVTLKGKTGVRPVLQITDTNNVVNGNSLALLWIENLELAQNGASGNAVNNFGLGSVMNNVKISDAGGIGVAINGNGVSIRNSEVTGVTGVGIRTSASGGGTIIGNYVHDNGDNCIEFAATAGYLTITNNVLDTCAGRGIYISGATTSTSNLMTITGNTIYNNGNSGLEVADADSQVVFTNNIFMNNGDAAGEFNVEWAAGTAEFNGWHGYNVLNTASAGGSANVSGMTINSTELTTNPSFTDAPNGDFRLATSSPAVAAGYPGQLLGATGLGYLDIGVLQQQEPAAAGGGGIYIGGF